MIRLAPALALVLAASSASAAVPDPWRSTWDPVLVGNSSGQDMGNAYHVTVRDVGNIGLLGKTVSVRFLQGGASPYSEQESRVTVDCPNRSLSSLSGWGGELTLHARVAGFDNAGIVEVRAQGVLLGHILVRSTDLNGDGRTNLLDLSAFRTRFLHDRSAPETDFDQNGKTDAFDLEKLRREILLNSAGTPCP